MTYFGELLKGTHKIKLIVLAFQETRVWRWIYEVNMSCTFCLFPDTCYGSFLSPRTPMWVSMTRGNQCWLTWFERTKVGYWSSGPGLVWPRRARKSFPLIYKQLFHIFVTVHSHKHGVLAPRRPVNEWMTWIKEINEFLLNNHPDSQCLHATAHIWLNIHPALCYVIVRFSFWLIETLKICSFPQKKGVDENAQASAQWSELSSVICLISHDLSLPSPPLSLSLCSSSMCG